MPSLDRPRITDETPKAAERKATEKDRLEARAKLLALAAVLVDKGLRYRLLESAPNRTPLLRVWNPRRQSLGETIACVRTEDAGWQYANHPFGPMLCSAKDVSEPTHAVDAGEVVAGLLKPAR